VLDDKVTVTVPLVATRVPNAAPQISTRLEVPVPLVLQDGEVSPVLLPMLLVPFQVTPVMWLLPPFKDAATTIARLEPPATLCVHERAVLDPELASSATCACAPPTSARSSNRAVAGSARRISSPFAWPFLREKLISKSAETGS
jgi:hypothetical protein